MPGAGGQRRQQEPGAHQDRAEFHDRAGTETVHHASDQRTHDAGDDEAEGEGPGGDASVPLEFGENGREQEGERGARVYADAHGDEGDGDDDPAVEDAWAQGIFAFTGQSRTARPPPRWLAIISRTSPGLSGYWKSGPETDRLPIEPAAARTRVRPAAQHKSGPNPRQARRPITAPARSLPTVSRPSGPREPRP